MNYKELPKGTKLYNYEELSDSSKEFARKEILKSDSDAFKKSILDFKELVKKSLHYCVNNKSIIPSLIRRKKHINKTLNNLDYIEKYIIGNLCQFTKCGVYVTFSI